MATGSGIGGVWACWINGIPVGDNPTPCADETGSRDCAVLVADAVGETNIMWAAGAVTSCILMAGGVVVYTGPGKWHTRSQFYFWTDALRKIPRAYVWAVRYECTSAGITATRQQIYSLSRVAPQFLRYPSNQGESVDECRNTRIIKVEV